MKLNFTKMNGAGNDFIVIYNQNFYPDPIVIQKLCDRHFGIGADGILWIQKSKISDFGVRYFNSDGSGDSLCVNGARCSVLFGYLNNLCNKKCRFEFIGKVFEAEIINPDEIKIKLDYTPKIEPSKEIKFLGKKLNLSFVDIGSRHLIIEWFDFENMFKKEINESNFEEFDINYYGRALRNHPDFMPNGVNVNFIKKIDDNFYKIRTYERGVESETLACGSGCISSAIQIYLKWNILPPIKFLTKSQKILEVNFDVVSNFVRNISLIGPAAKNFEGMIEI